ncbi:hypothetical protein M407DRAFT_27341 [Tulasnella calospora MUT 4182]|uniref:Uncharacterized protein n=1 Tax=Tulasnella calospora MUT 4182 TaxID=1051891 RepID=A0A0C3LP36_9AGAM|nr:hypothetical protein M407DRAFT_27341 [Tulasnella calospora MUT 4182]
MTKEACYHWGSASSPMGRLDHDPIPVLPSSKVLNVIYEDLNAEEILKTVRSWFPVYLNHRDRGGLRKPPDLEITAHTLNRSVLLLE